VISVIATLSRLAFLRMIINSKPIGREKTGNMTYFKLFSKNSLNGLM
jgi:hypothetical protein